MKIKSFIPPIFLSLIRLLKVKYDSKEEENDLEYKIGNYNIKLPPNHTLPRFQKEHKLYDKFLPILSGCLEKGKTIIDIGANVGDSAIMMLNETNNSIICIEPSDVFFPYLVRNIKKLPLEKQNQISSLKELVGTNSFSGVLNHTGGTSKLIEKSEAKTETNHNKGLDELISLDTNISMIKVDTDGYDFDVLKSSEKILEKHKPILFWENQIDNENQLEGYNELYEILKSLDYTTLYIFDNFGNLMVEKTDFATIKSINSYIFNMQKGISTRTLYYIDILASTNNDIPILEKAIEHYKNKYF